MTLKYVKFSNLPLHILTCVELGSGLTRDCLAHTRELKNLRLSQEAFTKAFSDRSAGLTHAALVGLRKQSVRDAERLLSYSVADCMETTFKCHILLKIVFI